MRDICDAAEHIGKPGLGIDIVELCGGDEAEHERGALRDTSISGVRVARELDTLVRLYGKPACIVGDNGTEFTSRAILKWASENRVEWHYIDPGKPQQNAFIESFVH